ncbi:hypothetical protein [Paraburkholderia adhaesiva]|uniref:hypothetical protein n=1 Tax=Paraburkholderia adhaesiva TaxID=2883244 RepID=UPI001F2ED197|nr:hypothetical protein [Paraburkholderia adhaesiva]
MNEVKGQDVESTRHHRRSATCQSAHEHAESAHFSGPRGTQTPQPVSTARQRRQANADSSKSPATIEAASKIASQIIQINLFYRTTIYFHILIFQIDIQHDDVEYILKIFRIISACGIPMIARYLEETAHR